MPISIAELENLLRHEKEAEPRDRLRAILMGMQGFSSDEIATRIGRSKRFVQKWAAIYQADGIEVVQQRKPPGAKSKLSPEEEARFSGEIMSELRANGRIRGRMVVGLLRDKFNQEYSLQGAYELLNRLGLPIRHPRMKKEQAAPPPQRTYPSEKKQSGTFADDHASAPFSSADPDLLRAVLDGVGDGILVVDLNGRLLLWNNRFLDLWSITPELAAMRDETYVLGNILDKLRNPAAFLESAQATHATPGQTSSDELPLRDGRMFERDSRPYLAHGRVAGRVWIFRDVTARARAELELQAQELRHSRVSSALGDLMARMETLNPKDPHAMPRAAAECLAHTLGVARAGIWFLSDEDTRIGCDDLYNADAGDYAPPVAWLASQCPHYFAAVARKRDLVAHDAASHSATAEMAASYFRPLGISALLDAPIHTGGRVVGVVRLEQTATANRRFGSEDSLMAGMVAGLMARHLGEMALRHQESAQAEARMGIRRDNPKAYSRNI